MKAFKIPKEAVRFGIGNIENVPLDAEEIKLFMRSGDPMIYIVPISEMSIKNIKNDLKIENE